MLAACARRFRTELLESVVPFWMGSSLDREYGGYFTCLDRRGEVYDTKKYVWLQGRHIWMFSRLYNELEPRPEFLEAARLGVGFVRRFGQDPEGRPFFSLTREGKPVRYQRKPYGAVFLMLGLLEFARAAGDQQCLDEAVSLFWRIRDWIRRPALIGGPAYAGVPAASGLADVMVTASMLLELMAAHDDPRYGELAAETAEAIVRHYVPDRRVMKETVGLQGTDLSAWPEGRLFNPGHSIEAAWFLLHLLDRVPNAAHAKTALDAIAGSLELGWDPEFGGLFYLMDLEGRPTLQLEATMKLWWPHSEAIYAAILAYARTGENRWLEWLARLDAYATGHFRDPEYGEWFGYCDRQGTLTHTCKGGNYKGFYHVPRSLWMCLRAIEQMNGAR